MGLVGGEAGRIGGASGGEEAGRIGGASGGEEAGRIGGASWGEEEGWIGGASWGEEVGGGGGATNWVDVRNLTSEDIHLAHEGRVDNAARWTLCTTQGNVKSIQEPGQKVDGIT